MQNVLEKAGKHMLYCTLSNENSKKLLSHIDWALTHNPEVVGSNPAPATSYMYAYVDGVTTVGMGVYF